MAEVTVAAAKPRFHFVVTSRNDSQKQRRRHEETADGAARSHAARISHSHRRSSINTDTRKWLVLKQSPRRAEKPQGPLAYVAVSTSYSSLDPFVELSLALSAQERNLVHCYLTEVPQALYGTTPRSTLCPVRITTLKNIAVNEIWLRWLLVVAQYRRLALHNGNHEKDPALLNYRSQAYQVMRKKLSTSGPAVLSDEVFYGLLAAGIAEDRIADSRQANYHLAAGLKILKARTEAGLLTPSSTSSMLTICSAFVGAGVQNYFTDFRKLSLAYEWTLKQLRAMQAWNWELRQSCYGSSHASASQPDASTTDNMVAYLAARRTFATKTPRCFGENPEPFARFDTRAYLGGIFALNTVLWACRRNQPAAVEFVTDVLWHVTENEAGAMVGGTVRLTPVAFLYVVAYCGSKVAGKHSALQGCFDIWDVVKFVEVIMLSALDTQTKICEILVSWLIVEMKEPESLVFMSVSDGSTMTAEVTSAWSQKQS